MNILVVDDNAKMREMVKSALMKTADHFIECSDGNEVVAAYGRHRPDWILMDVVMKEMDGITATKAVTDAFPDAKIIIMTQYNDKKLREKAIRAGALEFVLKENLADVRDIIRYRPS
jgi:two-component system, NarL family, response regulator LiaR